MTVVLTQGLFEGNKINFADSFTEQNTSCHRVF